MSQEYFNFDDDSNVIRKSTPSAKAINKAFCGQKGQAGIWISKDNMAACNWREDKNGGYANTKPHTVKGTEEDIEGCGVINPRIIVIRRTPLFRLNTSNGRIGGLWVKGDNDIVDAQGVKQYTCARRYLIVFVDEDNKPLHDTPIQLTSKGYFMATFDKELMSFRYTFKTVYGKAKRKNVGSMKEEWYSMLVFVPSFESKLVGANKAQSYACCATKYEEPTEADYMAYCIAMDKDTNRFVFGLYKNSDEWYNRIANSSAISKKDIDELDDMMSSVSFTAN